MKIRKQIVVSALLALALGASATGVGISFVGGNAAVDLSSVTLEAEEMAASYLLGEEIKVPQGELICGGDRYEADAVVHFPSGAAYLSDYVTLNETGAYTIEYRAEVEGRLVRKYVNFETLEGLYSVGSLRSQITYGKPSELGINYTTEQSPAGLCVSLANGDEFTYNGIVDLRESSKENKAIQLYLTPERSKAADAFSLYVKFTDIYDPDNYVIVSIWSYNMKSYEDSPCRAGYVTTCVPSIGQSYTGHYTTYQPTGGGWRDYIFKGMRTSGFCSFMSFYGDNANGAVTWKDGTPGGSGFEVDWGYAGYQQLGFWWDYGEKQLYSNQPVPEFSELVADYDDPNYYSSLWDGFTTGECYVSLWAEDYNNSTFNFVVTEMNGENLSEKEPQTTYKDVDAPVISVDYGEYTETEYPAGKIGCAYPVFEASAIDGYDGKTNVSTRVFYGYGTPGCYEISCGSTFVPDRAGDFTIVYRASDRAGNVAFKEVTVTVNESAAELVLNTSEETVVREGTVGIFMDVAESSYGGGVGELTYKVSAVHKESGREYDATDGSFRPMQAGTYEITVSVRDFIGQSKTYVYEAEVSESEGPVFETLPSLPRYLISGYTYSLPALSATDASGTEAASTIYLSDGGKETEAVGNMLTIDGENRTVSIIYRASAGGKKTDLVFRIPVINVKTGMNIDLAKYFDCDGVTATANNSEVLLSVDAGKTSGRAVYINPVLAEGFSSVFSVAEGNFTELALFLTDSENSDESIKFSWKNTGGTMFLYVNDRLTSVSSTLDFAGVNSSNFAWANATCTFTDNSTSLSVTVDKTYSGQPFGGFSSGKIYVSFEISGADGAAAVSVTKINNQTIRTTRRDVIEAQITFRDGEYPVQATVGEKLTLKDFVAADVLSPTVSVNLTVYDPEGNAMTSEEGTSLENSFVTAGTVLFTKAGTYTFIYTVSDGSKEAVYEYIVNCVNSNTITILPDGEIPETGEKGQTISVPKATCTAAEGGVTCYVLVINPQGVMTNITQTMSFLAESTGIYKVVYTAYDSSGNVKTNTYDIVVK